jgi:hypothetical protein
MADKRSLDNPRQLKPRPPNWPRRRDRIRPFSCGSEFADWEANNWDRCQKGYDEEKSRYQCSLERALGVAYIDDGKIDIAIAKRLGLPATETIWRCPEFEKKKAGRRR